MFHKLVEPIMFPLFLFGLFWFSERNKSPDRKADPRKMRFWIGVCSLMACGEYAEAWHWEIGLAWQNHPNWAIFSTVAVLTAIFASTGQPPDFTKKA